MEKNIEKIIRETLVISNKQSIHRAVNKILLLFDVSNRREQLIAYELKLWINPTQDQIEMAEQIVDMYLRN